MHVSKPVKESILLESIASAIEAAETQMNRLIGLYSRIVETKRGAVVRP
jgi:hypothetical protein